MIPKFTWLGGFLMLCFLDLSLAQSTELPPVRLSESSWYLVEVLDVRTTQDRAITENDFVV